jgi:hypothetical protein
VRVPVLLRPLVLLVCAAGAVAAAAWLALVEVFWLPLRAGTVLVPVSVVVAVIGNVVVVEGVHRLSGSRTVAVLPAVTWLVVAVAASFRRPEGDLVVLSDNQDLGVLGLVFLLCGLVAAAVAVGRVLARPAHPDGDAVSRPARHRAGSGTGGAR